MKSLRAFSVLLRVAMLIALFFCVIYTGLDAFAYLVHHVQLTPGNASEDTTLALITLILCLSSLLVQQSHSR